MKTLSKVKIRRQDYKNAYRILGDLLDCYTPGTEPYRIIGETRRIMLSEMERINIRKKE